MNLRRLFFNPAGLTTGPMQLSLDVQVSTGTIAAGASGAPGDNTMAFAVAARCTTGAASSPDIKVSQADTPRRSVRGASIDEEMISIFSRQDACSAAARLVSVADEMMQDVLAMVR